MGEKEHKKRTKSLMLLHQDLFVMTTTTVFRNLEEERIWDIDQGVRERFNAKSLYELALREDIPWRQWNHWVREKIVTYLRENNRIAAPQTINNGGMNETAIVWTLSTATNVCCITATCATATTTNARCFSNEYCVECESAANAKFSNGHSCCPSS